MQGRSLQTSAEKSGDLARSDGFGSLAAANRGRASAATKRVSSSCGIRILLSPSVVWLVLSSRETLTAVESDLDSPWGERLLRPGQVAQAFHQPHRHIFQAAE
jgi:hypothetical protein